MTPVVIACERKPDACSACGYFDCWHNFGHEFPCSVFVIRKNIHDHLDLLYVASCSQRYTNPYTGEPVRRGAVCMWYAPAWNEYEPCTVTPTPATLQCYADYTAPRTYAATWDALALACELQGR